MKAKKRVYVVTTRTRYEATSPLDALEQHYDDLEQRQGFRLERRPIEDDLRDVRLATPDEIKRRKANLRA